MSQRNKAIVEKAAAAFAKAEDGSLSKLQTLLTGLAFGESPPAGMRSESRTGQVLAVDVSVPGAEWPLKQSPTDWQ